MILAEICDYFSQRQPPQPNQPLLLSKGQIHLQNITLPTEIKNITSCLHAKVRNVTFRDANRQHWSAKIGEISRSSNLSGFWALTRRIWNFSQDTEAKISWNDGYNIKHHDLLRAQYHLPSWLSPSQPTMADTPQRSSFTHLIKVLSKHSHINSKGGWDQI